MAQGIQRLTDAEVRAAKPNPSGKPRVLSDGGGLRLLVHPNGSKYWQFRTAKGGKETSLQVGIYPDMSMAEARVKATELRRQLAEGLNLVTERKLAEVKRKASDAATFRSVADELVSVKRRNGTSESYMKKISGALEANLLPKLGEMPIQRIESALLKEILRPIEARGSLDMLRFVLRLSGEVFDLAKANGQFAGDNPAHALRSNVFAKHRRGQMNALPWEDMPGFLHRLDGFRGEYATACCVRLMMLTAARPGEVRQAKWAEFDLKKARWSIPAERMKLRREHRIPLATQAVEMLRKLQEITGDSEYLFPGQVGSKNPVLSDMALLKAVRRTAACEDVDAHGFRAVFRSHAEESGKWSFDVMEAALAHGKKNAVVGAYARATHYDARAKLAQWYADELDRLKKGGAVVPIHSAA